MILLNSNRTVGETLENGDNIFVVDSAQKVFSLSQQRSSINIIGDCPSVEEESLNDNFQGLLEKKGALQGRDVVGLNDHDEGSDECIIEKLRVNTAMPAKNLVAPSVPVPEIEGSTTLISDAISIAEISETEKKKEPRGAIKRLFKGGSKSMESLSDLFSSPSSLQDSRSSPKTLRLKSK
jgi:hypothetical protein